MENNEMNKAVTEEGVKLQATNIDEEGNVLFLDEKRFQKWTIGFKRYKHKSDGIGVKKFMLTNIIHLNDKRWPLARKLYGILMNKVDHYRDSEKNAKSFKKLIKIYPELETNTGTVVMPLNVDISDKAEKVTLPVDMLKEALRKSSFIAGMNCCLCRQSNICKDYPIDLGCLFLGESSRAVVKYGLAREFTYEEACERVDRAASLGLPAQSVWIEFEQPLWGIPDSEMDKFLEICFCCPCCCAPMRLSRSSDESVRIRFHPSGWTAVPNRTKCVGCGLCVKGENGCPTEAISIGEDKKVVINQDACIGCGVCVNRCKLGVISIKQTMPMREDILDYYETEYNIGIEIYKKDEETQNG